MMIIIRFPELPAPDEPATPLRASGAKRTNLSFDLAIKFRRLNGVGIGSGFVPKNILLLKNALSDFL